MGADKGGDLSGSHSRSSKPAKHFRIAPEGVADERSHDSRENGDQRMRMRDGQSIHGDTAAKRRAITELLFFASVGDLRRCQRIVRMWNLDVSDPMCSDYDKRTPLHLAASEGCYQVAEWLLGSKAAVNSVDRFKRTPLQDAVIGGHAEVAKFLVDKGGKVLEDGQLVSLEQSKLSGAVPSNVFELEQDWEIDPSSLTIMEKLGEGEFGIVHKAVWNGTIVAAKLLKGSDAIALGDFRSELEVLRRVHHPNAVQFLGACTQSSPYILVTEMMFGTSLADAFKLTQVFGVRRSIEIALDTARGLAYLHTRKPAPIIHRDLKPNNLMFSGSCYHKPFELMFDSGVVKLADFGLSKTLPINKHAGFELDEKFRLTGETGSYRYMAPEVFRHEPYNPKVDVYSFSMIAYQLFEHQPPFVGIDPVEAARQAALYEGRPPFVILNNPRNEVLSAVRALIERCWSPDPEDRPTFVEIVQDLEDILPKAPRFSKPPVDMGHDSGQQCCALQ